MPDFDTQTVLASPTGASLRLRSSAARGPACGIVLVQHGLAEHSGRYAAFAGELAAQGLHVFAHDHRGHGDTTAPGSGPRQFARSDGAALVLADANAVHRHALQSVGALPVIVFGHSMGGLIALNYARLHGRELAGAAIWNANFDGGLQLRVARVALAVERMLKGSDVASGLMARATFERWAQSIEGRRTSADWLSHDRAAVDAYLADPACGWTASVSLFQDLLRLIRNGGRAGLADLPTSLPLHLLGGSQDPATDGGEAVRRLAARFGSIGHGDFTLAIVAGARHETLNEIATFRQEALSALRAWLDRVIDQRDA